MVCELTVVMSHIVRFSSYLCTIDYIRSSKVHDKRNLVDNRCAEEAGQSRIIISAAASSSASCEKHKQVIPASSVLRLQCGNGRRCANEETDTNGYAVVTAAVYGAAKEARNERWFCTICTELNARNARNLAGGLPRSCRVPKTKFT